MPLRAAYLILSVLALTGCYYESNTPLLSSMETIPITRLEQDGTHYYEQESGNEYLILEISNGALKIKPRSLPNLKKSNQKELYLKLVYFL